jgi:hypothetical protein
MTVGKMSGSRNMPERLIRKQNAYRRQDPLAPHAAHVRLNV